MKRCTKCNIEKELSEFRKRIDRKSGVYSSCYECEKKNKREWYKKNKQKVNKYSNNYRANKLKDGKYRVYTLPNADYYVGQSCCIYNRMSQHRSKLQRDTSDYIILHTCDTEKEARWYEDVYHELGFPGQKMT